MEIILSFLISVMAEVVGYYVCKWLDGRKGDNQPNIKKPGAATPGFFVPTWAYIILLGYNHYTNKKELFNNLLLSIAVKPRTG